MKITKVEGQKLAVKREQTKEGAGYLYQNKNRGINSKEQSEIKRYVSKRVSVSRRLYSPFIQSQKRIGNINGKSIGEFQRFFKKKVFEEILINLEFNTNAKLNAFYQFNEYYTSLSTEEMELILHETLRKSLKRKETYPVLVDIVHAISNPNTCREMMSNIGNERLTKLFDAVMEDYLKRKEINTIVKSIEHQNVKVQVVQKDGEVFLELANAENERNKELFEELKRYSAGEEAQEQVLNHMNQALLLFYPECEVVLGMGYRFDIMSQLRSQIGPEIKFSKEVCEIFATNPDSKQATLELRTAFLDEVFSRKRQAIECTESETVIYWINHIALKLQNKFKKNRALTPGNNELAYIIEMSWKDMIEYLGKKYIDMGKAVYHFAMPVEYSVTEGAVFGEVQEEYRQGISSFDYEEIKANETIERKISESIHFAANQFQSAVGDGKGEILAGKLDDLRNDAVHSFLRYFGGASSWKNSEDIMSAEPRKFVAEIRDYFYYLRNRYYHYNSVKDVPIKNNKYANILFSQEQQLVSVQIRKKYYSNNIPMFFNETQVKPMMDKLYEKYRDRGAQIPSFQKVLKRKDLREFYKRLTKDELNSVSEEYRKQYEGMLYFLLKEIYYCGFLNDSSVKMYFDMVVERHGKDNGKSQNFRAEKNFINTIYEAENADFATVCQRIMTQYAMENNRNNLLADRKADAQKKYDHFPILLYQFIQEAFLDYINDNQDIYGFLKKKPMVKEMPPEEDYLSNWNTNMYQKLFENIDDNQMAWYLVAHFLPQREVNQLIGSIKNYIQFIKDIKTRARYAKIERFVSHSEGKVAELSRVLEILDFTLKVCLGRFSKEFDDYYWDIERIKDAKDIYAEEIAQYVSYAEKNEPRKYYVLSNFCEELSDEDTRAIYADGKNPILLRNVELARLFGMKNILPNVVVPVTKDELMQYEKLKRELQPEFNRQEQVKSKDVQKKLCRFQQMKNHVELHDVLKLAELANDLNSYLVSLAYIRERDLLYYQLGYYYMKLRFTTEYKKELNCLEGPDCSMKKGAALYQIQAMYTYGMELFDKNGCLVKDSSNMQTGRKIIPFHKEYNNYNEGMQLFGQEKRLDQAVIIRNIIDHAHYYSTFDGKKDVNKMSIMELYSTVYDYFFTYDRKLKKSVPIALENILLKYNIEGILEFGSKSGNKTDFRLKINYNKRTNSEYKLKSTKYTYKVKNKDKYGNKKEVKQYFDVCSSQFLQQVEKLLYFRPE